MAKITQSDALKMLSETFEEPLANLRTDTARDDIPGWDSMGALTLMAELDERFGIALSAEDSKQLAKIGDVMELLAKHGVLEG
jgi:acyl carrier protein